MVSPCFDLLLMLEVVHFIAFVVALVLLAVNQRIKTRKAHMWAQRWDAIRRADSPGGWPSPDEPLTPKRPRQKP